MKTVLIGGPRDGVEVELPAGRSYLRIPLHDGVAMYRLATLSLAGTPICGVLVWEGARVTREAAVRAIGRLYLAGALQ